MAEHLLKTPDERKQPSKAVPDTSGSLVLTTGKNTPGQVAGGSENGPTQWAVTELLDVSDFDALVPRPAHRFPFLLDGFQKQAVARLEVRLSTLSGRVDYRASVHA